VQALFGGLCAHWQPENKRFNCCLKTVCRACEREAYPSMRKDLIYDLYLITINAGGAGAAV
jgi:hypothetical protein